MKSKLFNSTSLPVPPLRRDIQIIPFEDDGRNLLLFYDPMKISESGFALDKSVEPILSLIDGQKSITQLLPFFSNGITTKRLIEFIQLLDEKNLLESQNFQLQLENIENQFEEETIRQPALVESSYPGDEKSLEYFMRDIMNLSNGSATSVKPSKALYAPHIDLRVGSKQYAEAFSSLKELKPKRVVILATAHYSGYYPDLYDEYPFIGSKKDYQLPGRILKTDRAIINDLVNNGTETGFTIRDRAHRIEHSIETHLLFANHIWKHDFQIVPILIAGLDEIFYKADGDLGKKIERFSAQLQQMDTEDTFYLISGDLSHVGKKFGDLIPAEDMRKDVENFDRELIKRASENNHELMLKHISGNYDAFRVCGFPPLYTFLKAFPKQYGTQINYHWWDERERESAVSFGSILY